MACSPRIWKKFNKYEKMLWKNLYNAFLFEGNFHVDLAGKKYKEQREVTAHNMACEATWLLKESGDVKPFVSE